MKDARICTWRGSKAGDDCSDWRRSPRFFPNGCEVWAPNRCVNVQWRPTCSQDFSGAQNKFGHTTLRRAAEELAGKYPAADLLGIYLAAL